MLLLFESLHVQLYHHKNVLIMNKFTLIFFTNIDLDNQESKGHLLHKTQWL